MIVKKANSGSWIAEHLDGSFCCQLNNPLFDKVEQQARETESLGQKPLWEGYSDVRNYPTKIGPGATRSSEQTRISKKVGAFFVWLVTKRKPLTVVEVGGGFGVSGMYWLTGLQRNPLGNLLTFEPNEIWAAIARRNLSAISRRFTLTTGTFEDNVERLLGDYRRIDMAFIDAIHICDCVLPQLELVLERLTPGGIVVLDDIYFSDEMRTCWEGLSKQHRFVASAEMESIGILEVGTNWPCK